MPRFYYNQKNSRLQPSWGESRGIYMCYWKSNELNDFLFLLLYKKTLVLGLILRMQILLHPPATIGFFWLFGLSDENIKRLPLTKMSDQCSFLEIKKWVCVVSKNTDITVYFPNVCTLLGIYMPLACVIVKGNSFNGFGFTALII